MSLINRMLRDLSARKPSGDVMSGIQLPVAPARPRSSAPGRLVLLAVLVVAFTAGLWWMFAPRPVPTPQPRGAPEAGTTASAPAPAPAPAPEQPASEPPPPEPQPQATPVAPPPVASAPSQPTHLKMDTELSPPGAAAPPRKPRPSAPRRPQPPLAAAPEPAAATKQEPAATPAQTGIVATTPRTPDAEELYAEAQRALQRGDAKDAEAALIETLALNPKLHAAREDLGTLRVRQGRFEEAERNLRIGLEMEPSWPGYRRLLARMALARRQPAAAIEALEKDPPPVEADVEYHGLLASAYQRSSRHEDASRLYESLVRVQPERASWWAGYAISRDALGDAPAALAGYARARQLGGLDPRVLEHINARTAALQPAG